MTTQMTPVQQEHFNKYEEVFNRKPHIVNYIPFTKEEVANALESGDEHLNTLKLAKWDMAASLVGGASLSQQVCALKHAAKYHYL